jgi:uncharacterized protein (DUF4415 family)
MTNTTKKSLDELSISKARLEELAAMADEQIDYSDIAELDDDFWEQAEVREPKNKESLTVHFDADMVQWFKQQGKGYQNRMNAVLRSFYRAHRDDSKSTR